VTGETFVALLPELVATGFLILTLMVGVFGERNVGLVAGLAALGSLAIFGSAAGLLAAGFSGNWRASTSCSSGIVNSDWSGGRVGVSLKSPATMTRSLARS